MKQFNLKPFFIFLSTASTLALSQSAHAGAFQIWEQDAASIGNYHAGVAAIADDASTAYYNPAGLIRIKNQQAVLGSDAVDTDIPFKGTIQVSTLTNPEPIDENDLILPAQPVDVQGGGFNFIPFAHYAAPLSDRFVFGLSLVAPFGAQTDYDHDAFTRYAGTLGMIKVAQLSPVIGMVISDKLSIGAGLDIQRMQAKFDLVGGFQIPVTEDGIVMDTVARNKGSSTAYGYHLGALYQFRPETRLGIAYHSEVTHHLSGSSKFIGRLANSFEGGATVSDDLKSDITLPSVTTLSLFHALNPHWDILGSITYVHWQVFENLIFENASGLDEIDGIVDTTSNLVVDVPEHFRNAWNYALGVNYHFNEKWMLRTGIGYDQTPTRNRYRNLQLPDSDRTAVALGCHYQAFKTLGIDAGYTHLFMRTASMNHTQKMGAQETTIVGESKPSADVFGLQVKWDIT